ncbi:vaccinia C4L/C10L-like protein [Mudlarkpox virus]|nr:vaccinia C4L/C10L-like protein [Mudlarkpox virus]
MGITCFNNNRLSLHMFSDIYLSKIKETISNKSNFDVYKENTNKLVMIEDTLKENIRSLVYDELKSLIDDVKVCNVFALITQEKECYLDMLLENQTYIDYKNKKTMCLLMFLKIYDNSRKIRYVDKDKNPFINITSDILFDKKLIHDLIIESGRKHIVIIDIDIDIKISPDTNLLATIEYLGSSINLYDKENDFTLCYCDIEIKKLSGYPYFLNVGLLFDRSGRCIKVHRDKKVSTQYNLFDSFEEFCINDVCGIEDIWIVDEDGKNSFQEITWSKLDIDNKDDDFLPIYSEFNKILCKLCCKNNIRNIKLRCLFNYSNYSDDDDEDEDDDDEDIYCFISRYYFDLPTKLELVDNIIRVLKEYECLMPNWSDIPIELKREILGKLSYLELSELLIKSKYFSESKVCNIRRLLSNLYEKYSYLQNCIIL